MGGELRRLLEDYRKGETRAEEVAGAFITARVVAHSPTFSWDTADTGRVLEMVTSCSIEPYFDSADAGHVADTLLAFRDKQKASLDRAAAQLAASMKPVWDAADQISRTMKAVGSAPQSQLSAMVESIARTRAMVRPTGIGPLLAGLPRMNVPLKSADLMPNLDALFKVRTATLNLRQVELPNLSSVLGGLNAVTTVASMSAAQWRLAEKSTLAIGEALRSVRLSADLARAAGDARSATAIAAAASDADSFLQNPDSDALFKAVEDLTKKFEEFAVRYETDRDKAGNENLVLWVYAVLIAIYLAAWSYLMRL